MREIPVEQVRLHIQAENPWWDGLRTIGRPYRGLRRRAYFDLLFPLVRATDVRRSVLLMGPRRVGKTVLLHHVIQGLLDSGADAGHLCYLSVDHPIYTGLSLEEFVDRCSDASGVDYRREPALLFLDEIQYLRAWEMHLKALVDRYPALKVVASGSAAAALRMKSLESGAGRFTDFLLPPLTFFEYLDLQDLADSVLPSGEHGSYDAADLAELNRRFLHYLNFGGYPEVVFSEEIQADPARFIKGDIIDKVLLRDLPGLYGIQDIQELNYLFTTLAFHTAHEVSLEQLSQRSGAAKNTIKKYLEYLEAAFLIKVVHRVDRSARRFQRANFFKVYLTNPSIRSALFAPLDAEHEFMGNLAETGIFSQWFHGPVTLHYARWNEGEVDIVWLGSDQKPGWAVEVKWSDHHVDRPGELRSLLAFARSNRLPLVVATTRTRRERVRIEGVEVQFEPASLYCYSLGQNILQGRLSGIPSR